MHRARRSYLPPRPVKPWVYAIARNVFLNNNRTFGRKVREALLAMALDGRMDHALNLAVLFLAVSMGFVAETGSGHILNMDGAPDAVRPENGGQTLAPRPMETVLAGTGGCTAYDVVLILKRGRHDVRGCSVKLTSERAEVDPKVFTRIHMQFTVTGKGIPASAVKRAIAMSHEKYCSASIMLGKTAEITTGFEVVEA